MKVLSTDGLTKLIQLVKSAFISVDDTVATNEVTLSTVATSGSYSDLTNIPTNLLKNTATGSSSLTILGTATNKTYAINIGTSSQATGSYGVSLGAYSYANGSQALGLGYFAGATANYAIQLGHGTNSTASTLYVGFSTSNYLLLDGTTGLIPDARISSNIARSADIPTTTSDLTNDSGFITSSALTPYVLSADLASVATSGSYDDLINKPTIPGAVTEATVSGWGFTKNTGTVTSVNNVSPVNGNVTLSIPTVPTNISAFTNDSGYITSSALNGYEQTSNKVTSISSSSTNTQYPSAKCVYDIVGDIETLINAL